MDRKKFIQTTSLAMGGTLMASCLPFEAKAFANLSQKKDRLLNAYYFRAHMYTLVPHQIKEDMKWMQDIGTDVVSIAVLEQDLYAGKENIEIICKEADKLGMKVFAVPSRWGGILAGAPKVPSMFTITHPQTYVLNKDGSPYYSSVSGRISSIHYSETYDFFCKSVKSLFNDFSFAGIIWDEPKVFLEDYSPKAIEHLGENPTYQAQINAACDFFSKLNQYTKSLSSTIVTNLFTYANVNNTILEAAAKIKHLDYFGCDGRPWSNADGGKQESEGKVLLGEEAGERFLKAAEANGKKALWLIENHNLHTDDLPLLAAGLPIVVQKAPEHLVYYYYPRNLDKPKETMEFIRKYIKN